MPSPGSRVRCYLPSVGEKVTGTLCGLYKNPNSGSRQWLMITDQKSDVFQDFKQLDSLGLPNSTVFIGADNVLEPLNETRASTWESVPPQIGVYVTQDFSYDGVDFPMGTVGRVACIYESGRIEALWNLDTIPKPPVSRKFPFLHPWEVPAQYVAFAIVTLSTNSVLQAWVDIATPQSPKFKTGDVVTYVSSRPWRVTGTDDRSYAMVKGTVLSVLGIDKAGVSATIIGNCQERMVGIAVRVDRVSLSPFPFNWIPEGKKVKVTQELLFKKKSLQGQLGAVLSSTDQDGDVGIQFSEDIGAGSLDGLGSNGKCLFVPAKALEISE